VLDGTRRRQGVGKSLAAFTIWKGTVEKPEFEGDIVVFGWRVSQGLRGGRKSVSIEPGSFRAGGRVLAECV